MDDPEGSERFIRVVGRRTPAPKGCPPPAASRAAMATMAAYRTRAPKGVFVYANHEEANRDRDRWTLAAMIAKQRIAKQRHG